MAASGAALALSAAALAQDEEQGEDEWEVDAALAVVSDYRFRGYSLSDGDPAIQPELTINHASGIYAGFWGSTLADNGGADIETDLAVGYATTLGPVDADVSVNWYHYPDRQEFDFVEFTTLLSAPLGPATIGFELSYAPPQRGIGNASLHYGAIRGAVPIKGSRLRMISAIGYEDSAFGMNKFDWSAGLSTHAAGFEFEALYIDATRVSRDVPSDPALVLSVRRDF